MNDFYLVRQSDAVDCGPACLKMIAIHFGVENAEDKIKAVLKKEYDGVSLQDISDAGSQIGLKNVVVRISYNTLLKRVSPPAILHWNCNHFIVFVKATKRNIHIADPMKGFEQIKIEEFIEKWGLEGDPEMGMAVLFEEKN